MTEHLILQAREMQKRMIATTLPGELADALEAQARRIAGYQKDADDYLIRLDELNALRARIAELEAALKPFADQAGSHTGALPMDAFEAARAALEKNK